MGAIEDIRKVMQDFLAPELRAIEERLKALELGLREFRTEQAKQFELADLRERERFEKAQETTETRFRDLVTNLNLEARMKRIENERSPAWDWASSGELRGNVGRGASNRPIASDRPMRKPKKATK